MHRLHYRSIQSVNALPFLFNRITNASSRSRSYYWNHYPLYFTSGIADVSYVIYFDETWKVAIRATKNFSRQFFQGIEALGRERGKRALPILGSRRTATSIAFITPYLSWLPATRGNHLLSFLQRVPLRASIFVPLPRCASMPLPCMHIGCRDNFDEAYTLLVLIFRNRDYTIRGRRIDPTLKRKMDFDSWYIW